MSQPARRPEADRQGAPDLERLTFEIAPAPPFRLDLTVGALRRRAINAIDRWDGARYRRTLVVAGRPLALEVTQIAPAERPLLQVTVRGAQLPSSTEVAAITALRRLLGFDRRLDDFYRLAAGDPALDHLARTFCGLKPPRFPTLFEALVNAFACQQVSLDVGLHLLNRLAATCAPASPAPDDEGRAFPSPENLAGRPADQLRGLGFSRQKAKAMIELADAVTSGRLDLDEIERLDDAAALERLCSLRGVGRWTAEYVLLRGLGRLHVFPGDDVGARNGLQRWLGLLEPLDYAGVQRVLARWHPFQGLVYLHLLLWSQHRGQARPATGARRLGKAAVR